MGRNNESILQYWLHFGLDEVTGDVGGLQGKELSLFASKKVPIGSQLTGFLFLDTAREEPLTTFFAVVLSCKSHSDSNYLIVARLSPHPTGNRERVERVVNEYQTQLNSNPE